MEATLRPSTDRRRDSAPHGQDAQRDRRGLQRPASSRRNNSAHAGSAAPGAGYSGFPACCSWAGLAEIEKAVQAGIAEARTQLIEVIHQRYQEQRDHQ